MTFFSFIRRIFGVETFTQPAKVQRAAHMEETMVAVAEELVSEHIRESHGPNQGPGIKRFWEATSYKDGYAMHEPWCAAAMCWIVREAAFRRFGLPPYPWRLPTSAAVNQWRKWAEDNRSHWQLLDPAKATVEEGDIVGWDFNGTKLGGTHIGLAISDERRDGTFDTAEGNTSPAGSRDGGGFYELHHRTRKSAIFIIRFIG